MRSSPQFGRRGPAARHARGRITRGSENHDAVRPRPRQPRPARHLYSRGLRGRSCPVTGSAGTALSGGRSPPDRVPVSDIDRRSSVTHSDPRANANRRSVLEQSHRHDPLEAIRTVFSVALAECAAEFKAQVYGAWSRTYGGRLPGAGPADLQRARTLASVAAMRLRLALGSQRFPRYRGRWQSRRQVLVSLSCRCWYLSPRGRRA